MNFKASKFVPDDFISNMPDNVVTNILNRLTLQDALRTGILSRNWRFKWTLIHQLVFDENFFRHLSKTQERNTFGGIISRLLLHLQGVITKFVFSYLYITDDFISHWILFLSRKGIEDLTIQKLHGHEKPLKLPIHLFSCLKLKHLKLELCCFDLPTGFHGFPNLLSLELHYVQFESGKFGEFCPALEILKMNSPFNSSKVKLAEIGKLSNLKILSLFMCNLDNPSSSSIFELVGFLPKLQELDLDFVRCKLTEDGAKKSSPTTFPCIKTLKLSTMDLGNIIMLSFAFEMIRSFPNLHTFEITSIIGSDTFPTSGLFFREVDYNTMGSLQLRSVVFRDLKGTENEVCLTKYLLASSPFLKKFVIRPYSRQVLCEFAGKLLKLQRAYPVVDIDLH